MPNCPKCDKPSCGRCRLTPAVKASPLAERALSEMRNSGFAGQLSEWGMQFRGRHLEPGIVTYDQPDGSQKTYLLTREAIERMRPTIAGKPIVGSSGDFDHRPVKPEDFKTGEADGIVIDGVDNGDGWDSIRFMVWDPKTKEKCAEGEYELSCAYVPTETDGKSGLWHNCPYDEEIVNGEYTHVAVVPNPRYAGAVIELGNSLKGGIKVMNKVLKSLLQQTVGLKGLREIVNSLEEDEKAEAAKKNAADEATKKTTVDLTKKNAADAGQMREDIVTKFGAALKTGTVSPAAEAAIAELAKKVGKDTQEVLKDLRGDSRASENAAPPDPAVEGHKVVEEEHKPDPGTSMAAAPNAEPKLGLDGKPLPNDGNIPPTKPEPGQPGSPASAAAVNADQPKPAAEAPKVDPPAVNADPPPAAAAPTAAEPEAKPAVNAEPPADGKCQLCGEVPSKLELRDSGDGKKMHVCADGSGCDDAGTHKNSLKVAKNRRDRRELLNRLRVESDKDKARQERFNSLRDAAESRGGATSIPEMVMSADDAERLGKSKYGSQA